MFEESYKSLNSAQKKAVDTIEGPVMVIAGPGTGKTQVLALRIANILELSQIGPGGILCLTFTRSGVSAMRARLSRYIGTTARDVKVSTFHSFAGELVEKYYQSLDFDSPPKLIDDTEAILIIDALLHNNEWEYIRPRTNPAMYFSDLKQLISILKRERMTPAMFLDEVHLEISALEQSPESISSRGESKGQLKKEVVKKIESLKRTEEVVEFYRLYEEMKREQNIMDYDDVLEYAVKIAESDDEARFDIQETYQYILIDEHQDSSGIQNSFLKAVWQGVESPNIFVVGDDRQLIFGFSGASISYFEEFSHLFGKAQLITLSENYRSTSHILSLADDLLQSSVTTEKLKSNVKGGEKTSLKTSLLQYSYERDEILGAGKYFKQLIDSGAKAEDCALLVPKNRHVRSAVNILKGLGLQVSTSGGSSLFLLPETQSIRRVLKIIADPYDNTAIAESLLDKYSRIPAISAHTFLHEHKSKDLEIKDLLNNDLFGDADFISLWGKALSDWVEHLSHERISYLVSIVGNDLFIKNARSHEEILSSAEILRSMLHAVTIWEDKNPKGNLKEFLKYLDRLEEYGSHIELATFGGNSGVSVMTLHKSKGLEYDNVWIAHMNEEVLMSEKKAGFTLPENIKEKISSRDIESAKRELYVAITRAKKSCSISYALRKYNGSELTISRIIENLSDTHFIKKDNIETEKELLQNGPESYVSVLRNTREGGSLTRIKDYVKENFTDTNVSVTLLNNFFDCPWKWYFRNFLKLPEIKSTSLTLGSIVHSAIEYILKSGEKVPPNNLADFVAKAISKEHIYDEKEIKRISKDALAAVKSWVDKYYNSLADERLSERSISYSDPRFPNLSMYGKIDLTEKDSHGNITVTDFKTGSSKAKSAIEKIREDDRLSDLMRQLAMYSYLMSGSKNGSVEKSRLLFIEHIDKDNELYETHIGDSHVKLLIIDIADYQKSLLDGSWTDMECHFKPYGNQTECQYCKIANNFIFENELEQG